MEYETDHEGEESPRPHAPSTRWIRGMLFFVGTVLFVGLGAMLAIDRIAATTSESPILVMLRGLVRAGDRVLTGETDDRINVLLLGVGGAGHEGGNLADTIILASIRPSTHTVGLLSLPRDLSVPTTAYGWIKVNAINAYAEAAAPGSGGTATADALAAVLRIPIPYYVRVDFTGFTELVDAVGGITVQVERRLDDPRYPILGKEETYPIEDRFEHLVIEPGTHRMDGATALRYARSRTALGAEGSDFARTKRQQNIVLAVREKTLSFPTLVNPVRIERMFRSVRNNIATNLTLSAMVRFADLASDVAEADIHRVTLSDAPDSILVAQIINGSYVLLPRNGAFDLLRAVAKNLLDKTATVPTVAAPTPTPPPTPTVRRTVAVFNGTWIPGLASRIGALLTEQGFTVVTTGNAPQRPIARTELYDRTNGTNADARRSLELFLDAAVRDGTSAPVVPSANARADFIVVLGENARIPQE